MFQQYTGKLENKKSAYGSAKESLAIQYFNVADSQRKLRSRCNQLYVPNCHEKN